MALSLLEKCSRQKRQHRLLTQRFLHRIQQIWKRIIGAGLKKSPALIIQQHQTTSASSRSASTIVKSPRLLTTSTALSPSLLHHISHSVAVTYVAILVLSTTSSVCAGSPCQSFNWWDPVKDKCIPCTECNGQLIVLRPCQLHRDTICGSIYDLEIDWMVLAKTEPNWKERRKASENIQKQLQREQLQAASMALDWQTAVLFLAVIVCLLFFFVAACILVHHMRQWRRMERRLDQDVEELSAKLMASLAHVQSLEGGTFYIENVDALKGQDLRPHHILLFADKGRSSVVNSSNQPGNVYIEEASSKG